MPPRDRRVLVTVEGTARHCGPLCPFEGFDGWCSLFKLFMPLDTQRRHLRAKACREAEKRAGEVTRD